MLSPKQHRTASRHGRSRQQPCHGHETLDPRHPLHWQRTGFHSDHNDKGKAEVAAAGARVSAPDRPGRGAPGSFPNSTFEPSILYHPSHDPCSSLQHV